MISGTTSKIAVSLPDELVAYVRELVRAGEAASVSAVVRDALEERMRRARLEEMLTEMLAESGGPMTDAERAAADRILGL